MSFWAGRRVLVTGHTGFKGSWLSLWLMSRGAKVTGFALAPPSQPSMFELAVNAVLGPRSSVLGDVRDLYDVKRAFDQSEPSVVFHLAAQSLVRASYDDPLGTYSTNVMGTAHVLDAARRHPSVQAVVVVTSDKCYENREWDRPYREDDAMGGRDPYSSSKGCAELVTAAYRSSFFSNGSALVSSARAGNVIGGGDWSRDRLIPDAVRAFERKETLLIRNPDAVRPWQHVLDPLSGYLDLAEKLCSGDATFAEGWNFGPGDQDARPVRWVVERFAQRWSFSAKWTTDAKQHPHEAQLLRLDASKARNVLGWHPRLSLDRAIDWTTDWYKAHAAGANLYDMTMDQINAYERLAPVVAPAAAATSSR